MPRILKKDLAFSKKKPRSIFFNLKYMLFWRVRNIAFWRALSTKQYQSALIVELLCWLNRMLCFPELYYSAEILLKNWFCPWNLETACRQSRMWMKKPNPVLTRYLLRLPRSKFRILVGLITGHCPFNKHLYNMGLIDKPISIACGMKDESAFHLLCDCPSLISLRMRTYIIWRGVCICTAGIRVCKWQIHFDSLICSILWTFLLFALSHSIC
jgi:hypothetical protein